MGSWLSSLSISKYSTPPFQKTWGWLQNSKCSSLSWNIENTMMCDSIYKSSWFILRINILWFSKVYLIISLASWDWCYVICLLGGCLVVPARKRCSRGKAREHMCEASLGHAVRATKRRSWRESYVILMYEVLKNKPFKKKFWKYNQSCLFSANISYAPNTRSALGEVLAVSRTESSAHSAWETWVEKTVHKQGAGTSESATADMDSSYNLGEGKSKWIKLTLTSSPSRVQFLPQVSPTALLRGPWDDLFTARLSSRTLTASQAETISH